MGKEIKRWLQKIIKVTWMKDFWHLAACIAVFVEFIIRKRTCIVPDVSVRKDISSGGSASFMPVPLNMRSSIVASVTIPRVIFL